MLLDELPSCWIPVGSFSTATPHLSVTTTFIVWCAYAAAGNALIARNSSFFCVVLVLGGLFHMFFSSTGRYQKLAVNTAKPHIHLVLSMSTCRHHQCSHTDRGYTWWVLTVPNSWTTSSPSANDVPSCQHIDAWRPAKGWWGISSVKLLRLEFVACSKWLVGCNDDKKSESEIKALRINVSRTGAILDAKLRSGNGAFLFEICRSVGVATFPTHGSQRV